MMKVVYYPAFFELRRFGMLPGIIGATLLVFFATWLLHAYQWFWLLGSILLTWPDVLFWSMLAFFLVINTVLEMRHRQRAQKEPFDGSVRAYAKHAVQTVAFFAAMCVLWSLWSSESVSEWLGMWSAVLSPNGG
jgi:predicted tellurium resistance membrane protein TerC